MYDEIPNSDEEEPEVEMSFLERIQARCLKCCLIEWIILCFCSRGKYEN